MENRPVNVVEFPPGPKSAESKCAPFTQSELEAIESALEDVCREKTDVHGTDILASDIVKRVRGAPVGRYRIFRRMHDDRAYWADFGDHFEQFSTPRLGHEPWIVAAALALRPTSPWHWEVVEAWSWVLRHAAIVGISVEHFESWLDRQDPIESRAFVTATLMQSGRAFGPLKAAFEDFVDRANDDE